MSHFIVLAGSSCLHLRRCWDVLGTDIKIDQIVPDIVSPESWSASA